MPIKPIQQPTMNLRSNNGTSATTTVPINIGIVGNGTANNGGTSTTTRNGEQMVSNV
jgi:hypothetical protein